MPSSNNNTTNIIQSEADALNWTTASIVRVVSPVLFVFGTVGNLLNIYVFTRPVLRRNPCAMYFLASTMACFAFVVTSIPFRFLQYGYNIDPTHYLLGLCKAEYFLTFTSRALTSWFLVLACVDRFLRSSSNVIIRLWSSFRVASRAILITILLVYITYLHVPIFYTINLTPPICDGQQGIYRIFLGFWHVIIYGSGPPLLMFIFSLITIRHVRSRRRLLPLAMTKIARIPNRDGQLLRMALTQCLFIGLTTSSFSVGQLYLSLTAGQPKDALQLAKDNFLLIAVGYISTAGHCATFYLFTLTSKLFREHLRRRF